MCRRGRRPPPLHTPRQLRRRTPPVAAGGFSIPPTPPRRFPLRPAGTAPRPAAAAKDSVVTVVPATAASALVPPAIGPPRFVSLRRLTPAEVHDARRLSPLPVLRPPPPSWRPSHFTPVERRACVTST